MKSEVLNKDHRLKDQLERTFASASFRQAVREIRQKHNLPKNGFISFNAWKKWILRLRKQERIKALETIIEIDGKAMQLCAELKLPHNYYLWVVAYVLLGRHYAEFKTDIPFETPYRRDFSTNTGFSCGLEYNRDENCVNIKIFAGAGKNQIVKYVKDNMSVIQLYLNESPERVRAIRKRRKRDEHAVLYEYFLDGDLKTNGEYVGNSPMPDDVKKYDKDTRRNIIKQQQTLQR